MSIERKYENKRKIQSQRDEEALEKDKKKKL